MLDVHRLRLLVELRRRGTLTAVGRALSYSPSTISQQLAQLEIEAGAQLLEPVGRRVRLTPAGELLVKHGETILVQLDRAEAELAAAARSISGAVRVATFQTAALSLLPPLLEAAKLLHPQVSVFVSEIQPDVGSAGLLARDFDLVLGETYPGSRHPPADTIDVVPMFLDPMRLYAPRALAVDRRALSDFADCSWVMEPRGKPARAWAESMCRKAGFDPIIQYESADLLVHVTLAETGHAVAVLPDLVWAGRSPSEVLVTLPDNPLREVYSAVRRGTEQRPVLVELRRVLSSIQDRIASGDRDSRSQPSKSSLP